MEEKETTRVEAFSDGIFSIAMTLLVIEIRVPGHDLVAVKGLTQALLDLWPSYLAFITSFVTILVIWVHHHLIFMQVRKADHVFLYLNGLLLLCVTFVPFPTALLADYLVHPDGRVAANMYTGIFLAVSLAFAALWKHASRSLLPPHPISTRSTEIAQINKQYRFGPVLYLLVFGISFASEALSVASCLLIALFFAIRGILLMKRKADARSVRR